MLLWNVLLAFSPCSIHIYERSEGNIDQFVVSFAVRQSQFNRLCNPERGWAFERVLDGGLDGYDHKTIPGTETRADCARLCLLEEDFDCRSAEYAAEKKRCVLSREDRRTQPEAFGTAPGVDYIENQCAKREFDKQSQTSSESLSETTPQVWAKKILESPCLEQCDALEQRNSHSFCLDLSMKTKIFQREWGERIKLQTC